MFTPDPNKMDALIASMLSVTPAYEPARTDPDGKVSNRDFGRLLNAVTEGAKLSLQESILLVSMNKRIEELEAKVAMLTDIQKLSE